MSILIWIVVGLIIGAVAKAIYPGYQGGGFLSTMILGLVGSFIGGTLATLISTGKLALTTTDFSIPGIIFAVVGALIAIFIWQKIGTR